MSAKPLVDEMLAAPSAAPAIALVDAARLADNPESSLAIGTGEQVRRFSIYAPGAAFDLIEELEFLAARAIDPNVYYTPQFLVPAMPRLDERSVRLMVVRDEMRGRSRLRLLMPYSIERAGVIGGVQTIRAWTHPFGPVGTLPLDGDDPEGTLASFFKALSDPGFGLPDILVLPDLRIDGPMSRALVSVASTLGLPLKTVNAFDRAALVKSEGDEDYLRRSLSGKRRREVRRQARLLDQKGTVGFEVAREPTAVRLALEEFLVLESSGWKGRARSALVMDRYRAAFAREAVNGLAAHDRARIYTLSVSGEPIASLVALVVGGEAFAWKMAYDERFAAASPGLQLMLRASGAMLGDAAIRRADSCAVPDHFLMNRVWKQRIGLATLVVGLTPGTKRKVETAAKGLEAMRRSRNFSRLMRERLRSMVAFD